MVLEGVQRLHRMAKLRPTVEQDPADIRTVLAGYVLDFGSGSASYAGQDGGNLLELGRRAARREQTRFSPRDPVTQRSCGWRPTRVWGGPCFES
jgi:hypothetical protein